MNPTPKIFHLIRWFDLINRFGPELRTPIARNAISMAGSMISGVP